MSEEEFIEELSKIRIKITPKQRNLLEEFYHQLIEWNQKINLTRITDKEEIYLKHFYDSLTIYKEIDLSKVESLCDVGSGAGFPGIVIKIMFPNIHVTLLDSLQKRVNYLNDLIRCLGLNNIEAIHTRAEEYALDHRENFEIVTARAVAKLNILSELCLPLVKENGYFVAMKANIEEELKEAKPMIGTLGGKIETINEFLLPIENSKRTIIKIKKIKKTDAKYPRKKIK